MRTVWKCLSALLLAAIASGCQTVDSKVPDALPTSTTSGPQLSDYQLQPGDVVESRYGFNALLNEQVVVGPDGKASFFGARDLRVAGLSLSLLRSTVIERAGIIDPSFDVVLRSSVGTRVYVTGEVGTPGEIVADGRLSALQAVSRAGGMKIGAQSGRVVLLRHDAATNEGKAYALDLASALSGANPGADIVLQPYDIIYVPRDRAGNVSLIFERIRNAVPFIFSLVYSSTASSEFF